MVEESRFRYRRDDGMAGGGSATDTRYARTAPQRAPMPEVRSLDRGDMTSRGANSGAAYGGGAARDSGRGDTGRADTGRADPGRAEPQAAYGQRYPRAPEPARDAGRPGENKDSLAELARLIGDQDPFAEFSDLERKGAKASSAEDDDYDDYDADADQDDDDDDRGDGRDDEEDDEGERWSAAVTPTRRPEPAPRAHAYGRAGGYGADPAPSGGRSSAPVAPAYGRPAVADGRASATYGAGRYDDEDDDVYAAPSRPSQLPAPRAGTAYSMAAAAPRAPAAPASPAVRTGYGSLARPAALPSPASANGYAARPAAASYDDSDDDDYEDDARGYDAEDDDDDYAPPAAAPRTDTRAPAPRTADPRLSDVRAYDSRAAASRAPQSGASPRAAALPVPAVAARTETRRAPDAKAYGAQTHGAQAYANGPAAKGQAAKGPVAAIPAPARSADRNPPQAQAYDTDDYDDGYDDEAYDDGYGAKPQDPRAYARGAEAPRGRATQDRAGAGEAAYAYSADRRDDYDDYDDAYDPQFADDGYMPPHGEEIYETEPRRRKGRMALLMVASVLGLAVAGAATFFAYRMAVGEATFGSATPEVIRADSAPVKTVAPPAADSQGKLITERLGAGGSPNERLVTREESPVEVTAATRAGAGATGQGEPKRVKTYAVRPDGSMAAPAGGAPAPAGSSLTAFAPTQSPVAAGVPGAAPTQTAAVSPPVAASGSYVVQVASQRSEADAQGSWKALQAKYPSLLGNYTAQVRKADLGERGVFYRAQVGPFASREQANDLCQALRGQGGDCIVNKN